MLSLLPLLLKVIGGGRGGREGRKKEKGGRKRRKRVRTKRLKLGAQFFCQEIKQRNLTH